MSRQLRAWVSVLGVTVVVTLAVFATVSAAHVVLPPSLVLAAASGGSLTCPATGCTASTCHASGGAVGQRAGSSATQDSGGGSALLTCPRTGCTAATCHATSGSSGGGYGRGYRRGYGGERSGAPGPSSPGFN